ncbi:MAG: hypothetical protein ACKVQK_15205 [Burkholderiales bacterium]
MRLLIGTALALAPLMAIANCLSYEREATLTGVVRFERATVGDRVERVPNLYLNTAVCTEGQGSDRVYVRREGVASVQLVLPPDLLNKVAENRPVTVLGTLTGRITGNPRIPVVLRVRLVKSPA